MERHNAPSFHSILSRVRNIRAEGLVAAFASEDARWALVSTSVTALIAGTVAWLGAGTLPQTAIYAQPPSSRISLLPYQVFMRLTEQTRPGKAAFASIGGSATIAPRATVLDVPPPASLDDSLVAEDNDTADSDGAGANGLITSTVTLESGDTLSGALTDAGATQQDANAVIAAMRKVYDPRALKAGQTFRLTFAPAPKRPAIQITYTPPNDAAAAGDSTGGGSTDSPESPGKLLSVSFAPTIQQDISIARNADDSFLATNSTRQLMAKYHRAGGKIDSSLYLATTQAGIPAEIVVQMIHMFSYQVDFQRDIHPGDTFQVLYSYYYTPDGKAAKQGVIDYATMTLGGKDYTLYRYTDADGTVDYLDAHGRSAKSLLMKTPVDGARISSGFGMRFHPVLGYTRMHKGVDFAVPIGTPVMAAGNGVVKFAGQEHGYGNFMLIQNTKDYATAYGHLSRFAPGMHPGVHVHQGQIVAYSGNTGITTGPHLHYEIRIDGKQVNPLTVKFATGVQLAGKELRTFDRERAAIDTRLAGMPLETRVASNQSGLRTTKD